MSMLDEETMRLARTEKTSGPFGRLRRALAQMRCEHDWATVWERDYERYVLGQSPSPFFALNGWRTVRVCRRCGKAEEGFMVPTEEVAWADHCLISHFESE